MDVNLNVILNGVPSLLQSFQSLAAVKEGIKYSCNEKNLTFYPSGGPVVEWAGQGWFSSWTQAGTRTFNNVVLGSNESHETLAANILKLKNKAELLASTISSVAGHTLIKIEVKEALKQDLIDILRWAKMAEKKIDVLKKTYEQEKEKRNVFSGIKDAYAGLIAALQGHCKRVSQNIEQHRGNNLQKRVLKAGGKDGNYALFSPLPDNMTDADILDIRGYLTENAAIFNKMKEKQLKRNPDYNAIFLKKETATLPASVHYISIDEFYLHLKQPSSFPGISQILRSSDKKVLLYVKRKLAKGSRNELKYLKEFKSDREFVTIEHAFTYYSKNQSKQSFILKEESMFSLNQTIEKGDLTNWQKYQITLDILQGLKIMHDKGIVHLNFKPENIFLVEENLGGKAGTKISAKIFGLEAARDCENKSVYNKALDIWMVGHVLYYLFYQKKTDWLICLTNQTIFDGIIIEKATESKIYDFKPSSPSIDRLIWNMSNPDTKLRPSVDIAIQYVRKLLSSDVKINELVERRRKIKVEKF